MPPRQPPRWRWRRRLVFRGLTATMWGVGESPDARPSADLHCLVRPTDVLAPSPASPTAGGLAWRLASWPLRWLAAGRRRTRGVDPSVSLRPVRLGQPDLPLPAVPRSRRRRAHARRAVANQPRARGLGRPGRRKGPSAARPAVLAPSGPEEASHQRLSATARRSASLCRSCASIRPGSRLGPGPWGLVVRWSGGTYQSKEPPPPRLSRAPWPAPERRGHRVPVPATMLVREAAQELVLVERRQRPG